MGQAEFYWSQGAPTILEEQTSEEEVQKMAK